MVTCNTCDYTIRLIVYDEYKNLHILCTVYLILESDLGKRCPSAGNVTSYVTQNARASFFLIPSHVVAKNRPRNAM